MGQGRSVGNALSSWPAACKARCAPNPRLPAAAPPLAPSPPTRTLGQTLATHAAALPGKAGTLHTGRALTQLRPQAPQCEAVVVCVSQPFVTLPSQSAQPGPRAGGAAGGHPVTQAVDSINL